MYNNIISVYNQYYTNCIHDYSIVDLLNNTVKTEPEILGSRENTTLGGLYFPSNPKTKACMYV